MQTYRVYRTPDEMLHGVNYAVVTYRREKLENIHCFEDLDEANEYAAWMTDVLNKSDWSCEFVSIIHISDPYDSELDREVTDAIDGCRDTEYSYVDSIGNIVDGPDTDTDSTDRDYEIHKHMVDDLRDWLNGQIDECPDDSEPLRRVSAFLDGYMAANYML